MNERSIALAEMALIDFLTKNRSEYDYFRGRLTEAEGLHAPDQHMVSAAIRKVNWYEVRITDLEGELQMLREEFGIEEATGWKYIDQERERGGGEEANEECDSGTA